ncbi:hypothetical protein M513_09275 [Trichuris suis]|uniref:Uncharacterized protein n=1 Tax=Trichuris suis TaxID=68888 RepID=A0A085LXW2_9BILA|nr:hypothetical protein M513_09275 [Trichuris suis]
MRGRVNEKPRIRKSYCTSFIDKRCNMCLGGCLAHCEKFKKDRRHKSCLFTSQVPLTFNTKELDEVGNDYVPQLKHASTTETMESLRHLPLSQSTTLL